MRRCASILPSAMNTADAPSSATSTRPVPRADRGSAHRPRRLSNKKRTDDMGRNDKGNVGFIGIGTMGREMVRNLLAAGHAVRVFDLNEAVVADSVKGGATRASSPADAAQDADIVITMLPDTPHVEAT